MYYGPNFSRRDTDPVCYSLEDGKSNHYTHLKDSRKPKAEQNLHGIDCGKGTFVKMWKMDSRRKTRYQTMAGRQTVHWPAQSNTRPDELEIGPFDDQDTAAVTFFGDKECS